MTDNNIWHKAVLLFDSTLQQVITNLNESSMKIVLVVNEKGEFQGTISDGDIRRGLLKGLNLSSRIDGIIHFEAFVVPPHLSRETVMQLMLANKIQQVPIVNENQKVVGLHLWDEITVTPERSNLMVIMAGGKGTRLLPHTKNCPKPLVLVAGKPMLEHIIERGKSEGFNHFVIAINHFGHMIEEHFGNGEWLGVKIDYLREQSPLGTAGALSLLPKKPDLPFVVTNGDVITDIHYGELLDFHNRYDATATMAVRLQEWQNPFGVVKIQGVEVVGFEEKPITRNYINAGVYVLSPKALHELIKNTPCDMPTLFERLQPKAGRIVAYPMHELWLDVGRPEDLLFANLEKS